MSVTERLTSIRTKAGTALVVRGPSELTGIVELQGSKNTALKVLPALAALPGTFRLYNVPLLLDTLGILEILEYLGAHVKMPGSGGELLVDTRQLMSRPVPFHMTRTTTAAFYLAGPLLGRFGEVTIGKPGGDRIGARPVDYHIAGLRALGASVEEEETILMAKLPKPPVGAAVRFRSPSAGASVNVLLAVLGAKGSATVEGVPRDSDTISFLQFLQSVGTHVTSAGPLARLDATGMSASALEEINFRCPVDRNDAFTWLAAGCLSRQGITVRGVDVQDVAPGLEALRELSAEVDIEGSEVRTRAPAGGLVVPPRYSLVAGGSPGFHSDWAPCFQLCLAVASGRGTTIDTLHSNRVYQARLLQRMGVAVSITGGDPPNHVSKPSFPTPLHEAEYIVAIEGPTSRFRPIEATLNDDVRACAVTVLAACKADGISTLRQPMALYRGYESFSERLLGLGAAIHGLDENV